jgi:hypothetical protein
MKKMEGANIKDIDKQINELKDEKSKVYSDLGTASGTKFVEKFNAITGLKINKISTLTQLFDPKSSYYIDNIKKAVELAEDEHKIRGRARQEEVNELIRALGYLEAMKKTEFGPALQQIADLTEKQKTELAGYYEGYVGNFQKYYEIQGNINEANKNAAQEEAETKIKAAKNLADFEKKALIERLKIELDAYSDNLYREIVPQARYGSDTGKIQRIQANPELALTAKTTKPAEISRQQFTFEKNPYINDEEIAKYDATQKKMSDLGLAIQINTEKFGAQSQQVQVLQQQLDKLQDPTGFNKMGEGLEQLAGGFDALANSIDSPAMRIAAFSLHLMSGVKAIAAAAGNPFTFIAATASVMASIISFASSMKSQSFATGGIVAPGKSGDQMHVMMNPQEMILNKNQQTRLFNIINQGRPESSPTNNVVFRLEGQQLVGLISNYNKKHA